jgi:hypothetical protein
MIPAQMPATPSRLLGAREGTPSWRVDNLKLPPFLFLACCGREMTQGAPSHPTQNIKTMPEKTTTSHSRAKSGRRSSKRGSKVFSGCWTCRDRRVKCDELRPSCKRCDAAGLKCQGYSIRLVWKGLSDNMVHPRSPSSLPSPSSSRSLPLSSLPPDDKIPRYSQRSSLQVSRPASTPSALSRAEVSSIQSHLKDSPLDAATLSSARKGLFSVFCAQAELAPNYVATGEPSSSSSASEHLTSTIDNLVTSTAQSNLASASRHDDQGDQASRISGGTADCLQRFYYPLSEDWWEALENLRTDSPPSMVYDQTMAEEAMVGSSQNLEASASPSSFNDSEALAALGTTFLDTGDNDADEELSAVSTSPTYGQGCIRLRSRSVSSLALAPRRSLASHLDLVHAPAEQSELIMHFVTTLSRDMSPVYQVDKPQHYALLPVALAGLNSSAREFDGEIAVCHGICSASAFNLSRLKEKENRDRLHQLGIQHRQLALSHLRRSIARKEQARCTSNWAAILTLLIHAGVQGQAGEWRTHVKALRSLIIANLDMVPDDMVAQVVLESCLCISVLGNSHDDATIETMLDAVPSTPSYMETAHGISRSLLETIHKINLLALSIRSGNSCTSEADQLHLQLLLHAPGSISTVALDASSATLLLHYSSIYYYSTLIYFERLIRRRCPTALQGFVGRVLEHLEAIEMEGKTTKGCIWTWPCLVTSAECIEPTLKNRMLVWFEGKRRHGFANMDIACDIAKEVWRRRDLSPDNPGEVFWQDVTNGTEYDILPL